MDTQQYTCPVCGEQMAHDMIRFLSHVKQEIIQNIKKKRPDWTPEQGICPDCKSHYESWFDKIN